MRGSKCRLKPQQIGAITTLRRGLIEVARPAPRSSLSTVGELGAGKARQPREAVIAAPRITTRRSFCAVGGCPATAWLSLVQAERLALAAMFPSRRGIVAELRPSV